MTDEVNATTTTLELRAREILASEYEANIGEGPFSTYAELSRRGHGDFTRRSIRAVMRALESAQDVQRNAERYLWLRERVNVRLDHHGAFVSLPIGNAGYHPMDTDQSIDTAIASKESGHE